MHNPDKHKTTTAISVIGIDGAGKDTSLDIALQQLAISHNDLVSAKLGTDSYLLKEGTASSLHPRLNYLRQNLHRFAQEKNIPPLVTAAQGLSIVIQSRLFERQLSRPRGEVDLLASVRDSRIDPAIYASIYSRRSGNRSSVDQRVRNMQRLTGSRRDMIIFLNTDPRVAIRRIDQSLGDDTPQNKNRPAKDYHETPEKLAELSAAYKLAMVALRDIQPTPVVEIDNNERSAAETAAVMIDYFDRAKAGSLEVGDWVKL